MSEPIAANLPAVAVIGALQQEVDLIHQHLENAETRTDTLGETACGTYGGMRVAATVAGMGTVNTAAVTQHVIDAFQPRAVIFSGIAGGLNRALHIADVVVGQTLRYTDTDTALIAESAPYLEEFASTPTLVNLAAQELAARGYEQIPSSASNAAEGPDAYLAALGEKNPSYGGRTASASPAAPAAPADAAATEADGCERPASNASPALACDDAMGSVASAEVTGAPAAPSAPKAATPADPEAVPVVAAPEPQRFLIGCVATGNRFVTGAELRARALEQTHGDCAEMEGAAIAHICARNGVDCLVLRAISDNCDEAYDAFCARSFDIAEYAHSASELVLGIIARMA